MLESECEECGEPIEHVAVGWKHTQGQAGHKPRPKNQGRGFKGQHDDSPIPKHPAPKKF